MDNAIYSALDSLYAQLMDDSEYRSGYEYAKKFIYHYSMMTLDDLEEYAKFYTIQYLQYDNANALGMAQFARELMAERKGVA